MAEPLATSVKLCYWARAQWIFCGGRVTRVKIGESRFSAEYLECLRSVVFPVGREVQVTTRL